MEAEVYKTLLQQVEDELGATPGAYCSRKVAVRAMELLRTEGKKQSDEDIVGLISQIRLRDQATDTHKQTIEYQTQAIKRLKAEKTRGTLGPQHEPRMGVGILEEMRRNSDVFDYSQENMREALNSTMPDAGKNSEGGYFAGFFGHPEPVRRANWDGREEPLTFDRMVQEDEAEGRLRQQLRNTDRPGNYFHLDENTLDIYHEVID